MGFNLERATPLLRQAWVACAVLIVLVGQGMGLGYSSALLPALQAPDSPIHISIKESSWLVASLAIACVVSYLVSPYLMFTLGRRRTMMLEILPGVIGCVITYFGSNVATLIAGRFLNGLTIGSTGILGAIVIGEYSDPIYRGVFLNLKTAMLFVGCTIVHLLGHFFHWRLVSIINAVPYAIALMIVYLWPESPAWLAEQRNYEECVKTFYWLRGKSSKSTKELEELIETQKQRPFGPQISRFGYITLYLKKFKSKTFLKPLVIAVFGSILLETSGRHVFPSYALQFIGEITEDKTVSFYYNLIIDLIITISAFIASILAKRVKRRTLLFSTGAAAVLILLSVCLFIFLQSRAVISKDLNWVALVLFALYFVLVNLGCSPIPLGLVGEIFPLKHRASAACIAGFMVSVMLTVTLKITPFMLLTLKLHGTFAIYALGMAMSLFAMYFLVPETKDKTLQEIENYFKFGNYKGKRVADEEEACHYMVTSS